MKWLVCASRRPAAILEFSLPKAIHSERIICGISDIPEIGNMITHNHSDAYTYLNQSVEEFPSGEALATLIKKAGFGRVDQFLSPSE